MMGILKNKKGVSLIELVVVIAIIGILAGFAIPQYGIFIAKGKVRKATNDFLQNIRLARTMAIKENETYLITIAGNTYSIGFDGNGNGTITDPFPVDGYSSGPIITFDMEEEYGSDLVIGTTSFTTPIPNGPDGMAITNAATLQFDPDGSVTPSGPMASVYMQHSSASRGYTFCVNIANAAGSTNLFLWDGDAYHLTETAWTELR